MIGREEKLSWEGERVPKGRGIVTEGIRKVFNWFVNSAIKIWGLKELELGVFRLVFLEEA